MADSVTGVPAANDVEQTGADVLTDEAAADTFDMTDADQAAAGADDPAPADERLGAGAAEAAAPAVYAPDPAGTRPKVVASSVLPRSGPIAPLGGALGQTFRPPPGLGSPAPAGILDEAVRPLTESPHAPRFQFILGALLALGLSAIAITAYALSSGRSSLPTDWSAWHPSASGVADAATQIANHVAGEYRQPVTGQLLAVKGGPLALDGVPVTIALKTGVAATGGVNVLNGNAILYKMCGLGPGCSITGKASAERLMLVRREALELALYTFQYVNGADQVVVFLPPVLHPMPATGSSKKAKVTTDPTDAVFFRSSDLSQQLGQPLTSTLTQLAPSIDTVDKAPDTPAVDSLTSPSFYKFSFVQTSQDASLFLVLQPFAVGN